MLSVQSGPQLGTVETIVTSGRGLNPAELARMALPKLMAIDPAIAPERRAAAAEQLERTRILLEHYFAQAQKSNCTTIYNVLMLAGHENAAEIVRNL